MSWKESCWKFIRKYGSAAKLVATSVLNVVAPGSGAVTRLVDKALDVARDTAEVQWEEQMLQLTQNNTEELTRLGDLMQMLLHDLGQVCDKAHAFSDEPDDIEDIVRRALSRNPALVESLQKLEGLIAQTSNLEEQNRQLLDGQDEMIPILRRLNGVADFVEECVKEGVSPKALAELLGERQEVTEKIYQRQTSDLDLIELREQLPHSAEVCLLEAGAALVEHDYSKAQEALSTAVRIKDDEELVEMHRHVTRVATSATPRSSGIPSQNAPRLQVGDVLDEWTLESRLGAGGWGQVFKATREGETKALKIMHPEFSTDARFVARFRDEIKALLRLPRHDNLVRIEDFNFSRECDCWYLVMDYINGPTLEQFLATNGPLNAESIQTVFAPLAEALGQAHSAGIFHRDIKPGNLVYRRSDHKLVLVDFGLAIDAGDLGKTRIGGVSISFAAPEQLRGRSADARSDVFSLAATMNYALFADNPELRDPDRFDEEKVPTLLRSILRRALRNNPERRYQNATELHSELISDSIPEAVPVEESPAQRVRRLRQEAEQIMADVRALMQIHEYEEAAKLIENAPSDLLGFGDASLIQEVKMRHTRICDLRQRIQQCLGSGKYSDLRLPSMISQLLRLNPNDAEMRELSKEFPEPAAGHILRGALNMKFAYVPAGFFLMGGGGGLAGSKEVIIEEPFYMGVYPVTQSNWLAVTGERPSCFSRHHEGRDKVKNILDWQLDRFPVERVSLDDIIQRFLDLLNRNYREKNLIYRLPTDEEWEYACRGGGTSSELYRVNNPYAYHFYLRRPSNDITTEQANFAGELGRTSEVGQYKANALGIHDMHGNVWEWTTSYDRSRKPIMRGGSWGSKEDRCLASVRDTGERGKQYNTVGFRLVAVPDES